MLKAAACVLILGGSTLLGVRASGRMQERIKLLGELQRIILNLSREISGLRTPLAEAFIRTGKKAAKSPAGLFFIRMGEGLEAGGALSRLWEEEAGRAFADTPLTAEDLEELKELGKRIGLLDTAMQEELFRQYQKRLEEAYQEAREEYKNKAKLYQWLGVSGGLFLLILWF